MKKIVFITGAAYGTGFAIAKKYIQNGYDVCITSRDENKVQSAVEKLIAESRGDVDVLGFKLSTGSEKQVIEIFNEIKKGGRSVDVLILNAANLGIGMPGVLEIELNEWMKVIETNLGWNFSIARQAALQMKEKGKGSIVFVGSVTAERALKYRSAYSTSKGGISSLSRCLAVELGEYGIRVNTVVPGLIKTERYHNKEEIKNSGASKTPLGDVCEFEDIANAVWYFGSDNSRIVTGAQLVVDGGLLSQLVYED